MFGKKKKRVAGNIELVAGEQKKKMLLSYVASD